jgi:hypothetical protein
LRRIEQAVKTERKEIIDGAYGGKRRTADAGAADLQDHVAHAAASLLRPEQLGTKEDFGSREEPAEAAAAAPAPAANDEPEYLGELKRLSQLRDQGIITNEDFEAKKKQLLGI